MKITLLVVGKTTDQYLKDGIEKYLSRLKYYATFRVTEIAELKNTKNLSEEQQKLAESEFLFKNISAADFVILLDENGKEFTSENFAGYIEKKLSGNIQHCVFIVGGPYGFHQEMLQRANDRISLSRMTFSHQMVRLFFSEQLYRAFTILKGEPYHHK